MFVGSFDHLHQTETFLVYGAKRTGKVREFRFSSETFYWTNASRVGEGESKGVSPFQIEMVRIVFTSIYRDEKVSGPKFSNGV